MSGTDTVQEYWPDSDSWSVSNIALPAPLFEGCAVSTKAGLVVIGDFEAGQHNGYILVAGQSWQPLPLTLFHHSAPACAAVRLAGQPGVLVLSGQRVEFLQLAARRWEALPGPVVRRSREVRPSLGVSLGRVVLAGGLDLDTGEPSSALEVWDEAGQEWGVDSSLPGARLRQTDISLPLQFLDNCDII